MKIKFSLKHFENILNKILCSHKLSNYHNTSYYKISLTTNKLFDFSVVDNILLRFKQKQVKFDYTCVGMN